MTRKTAFVFRIKSIIRRCRLNGKFWVAQKIKEKYNRLRCGLCKMFTCKHGECKKK